MAHGDRIGRRGGDLGKKAYKKIEEAAKVVEEQLEAAANLEVGDFVAELATAMRYREKSGLSSGDWFDEPERLFTDGRAFGEEIAWPSGTHLQVTVSIDCSASMWHNSLMRVAGPAMIQLDRYLRGATAELPEGCLTYAAFAWAMDGHDGRVKSDYGRFAFRVGEKWLAELAEVGSIVRRAGRETHIAPLFRAIQSWESGNDPGAYRLDVILTDGVLEHVEDVVEATRVQEERDGRLSTVLLNFLPRSQWGSYALPDRCYQYAVTAANLATVMRTAISEAVQHLD